MNTANGTKPVNDLTADPPVDEERAVLDKRFISWKDDKRMTYLRDKIAKADDPDQALAFIEEFQVILAKAIVSIPQSWLVPGAPVDLDWHDPASLDWMQSQKMNELSNSLTVGGTTDAKNLPAT